MAMLVFCDGIDIIVAQAVVISRLVCKVLYVELCAPEGYVVETKKYKLDEDYSAEECFYAFKEKYEIKYSDKFD